MKNKRKDGKEGKQQRHIKQERKHTKKGKSKKTHENGKEQKRGLPAMLPHINAKCVAEEIRRRIWHMSH